jgi:hypothetical protein
VWCWVDWSSPWHHATLPTESHDSVLLKGKDNGRFDSRRTTDMER